MKYQISGSAIAHGKAVFSVRENETIFGIASSEKQLPNPAELLLGSFAACCLKNIERFSELLKFDYESAQITVVGERQSSPPKLKTIRYTIQIKSEDKRLNVDLLHKNIKNHGTIFNTLKEACEISGEIAKAEDYV